MSVFEPDGRIARFERDANDFSLALEGEDLSTAQAPRPTLAWMFAVCAFVVLSLCTRLFFLQVASGADHELLAAGNRIRTRHVLPPRGLIFDRNGELLAKNVAAFALQIVPANLPEDPTERELVYTKVARLTNQPAEQIAHKVEAGGLRSLTPVTLADHLDHDEALTDKLVIGQMPGIEVVEKAQREYENISGLAHILGYTGNVSPGDLATNDQYLLTSIVGRTGVEATYEDRLQGIPGVEQVEVDSRGYFQRVIDTQQPIPGDDITLTLDAGLERKLSASLEAARTDPSSDTKHAAAGVAIDPRNGEILAMVSLPDYDNNDFAHGISPDRLSELTNDPTAPLTNRAVSGVYPSGSVIKPFVAAGGLADGIITPDTTIDAPGQITVGKWVFRDWKTHGLVNVTRAIAVSSDVFFYAVGGGWDKIPGLGVDRLTYYLQLFGFGKKTGIDLPSEAAGLVPTPAWKELVKGESWYLGDTYHLAIGQGDFLSTPLQVAHATATIAADGQVSTPHVLFQDQPHSSQREPLNPPTPSTDPLLPEMPLVTAKAGMGEAVRNGSARLLQQLPVSAGGKTGTAQFGTEDKTHAWSTAFAPYDDSQIALAILVEGAGGGDAVAMPVIRDVLDWYFTHQSLDQ